MIRSEPEWAVASERLEICNPGINKGCQWLRFTDLGETQIYPSDTVTWAGPFGNLFRDVRGGGGVPMSHGRRTRCLPQFTNMKEEDRTCVVTHSRDNHPIDQLPTLTGRDRDRQGNTNRSSREFTEFSERQTSRVVCKLFHLINRNVAHRVV